MSEIKNEEVKQLLENAAKEEAQALEGKDVTEVKTLQQMSVEQNVKLPPKMTPEQYQAQMLLDHHMGMSAVVPAFHKLSKHGKDRLFTALMQLPHEGLEVNLNGNFEKQIYLAAQKAQMAKHAILFNRAKREADMEAKATAETEKKRLQTIAITDNLSVESKDDGTTNPVETSSQTEEVIKI